MGDFHQNGLVTTLHNLHNNSIEDMEKRLISFSRKRPMSLILPCLFSELEGEALPKILDELEKVPYLDEIIIGLDRADKEQFRYAKEFFKRLPQNHRILWNDGPRLSTLDNLLVEKKIAPKELGKGRNAWYCFGYFNASGKTEAVALHDCDIIDYKREMLARLFYPVVDNRFNYNFCKGYYYRHDEEQLNGRVARMLVTPLLRTFKKFFPGDEFLEYLDGFRYPLAGEFSMRADVTRTIRIPGDWGLEIGILSEVHRNNSLNRICQVEIADCYDHKHQSLSNDDPDTGLSKMSLDITKALFGKMAANGAVFSHGLIRSITSTYHRVSLDFVEKYYSDAIMNGLDYDRHTEEHIVDLFTQNIYKAGEQFIQNPKLAPSIPSWKRVVSAIPEFLDLLMEAVEADHNEN